MIDFFFFCSNTWIIVVASLVSVSGLYPYSRSTIYRNISNFISDILDFNTNGIE